MEEGIINRVEKSGIVTLDLEVLIPALETETIDIKDQLFQELLLRENDFRAWVKEKDWSAYAGKAVAIYCSNDAIVPTWAYMLMTSALSPHKAIVFFTEPGALSHLIAEHFLCKLNPEDYTDKRVVIKGCGDRDISNHAYVKLSAMLVPHVKTMMFGEPCSTVPVYKKRK